MVFSVIGRGEDSGDDDVFVGFENVGGADLPLLWRMASASSEDVR